MRTHIAGTTGISQVSSENHRIVSRDEWVAERKTLLAHEKELTRLRDRIARECRALPWVRIDKNYVFHAPEGRRTLAQLFEGRRQLLVQHFMFAPGWEQGCPSCSFMADHSDGMNVHLAHRDVTLVAVSRAPLADIERFRQRMGWQFKWVSSHGSDFNYGFGVAYPVHLVLHVSLIGLDSINKTREVVAAVFRRRKGVERMSRGVGLRPCGRRIRKQTLAHSGPRGSSRRWRARF